MWTHRVDATVDADVATVSDAILEVVDHTWGAGARAVTSTTEHVYAVDGDVWLTWRVVQLGSWTRVSAVLDEVESGPDPTDALKHVLGLVTSSAVGQA